ATSPIALPLASAWSVLAVLLTTTIGKSDLYLPTHPDSTAAASNPVTTRTERFRRIGASISDPRPSNCSAKLYWQERSDFIGNRGGKGGAEWGGEDSLSFRGYRGTKTFFNREDHDVHEETIPCYFVFVVT